MSRLRTEMQTLIESPPAPAAPVSDLIVRAAQIRRHRSGVASVIAVLTLAASLFAAALPDKDRPTQVDVGGGGPASAGYIAKEPGGYEGTGDWTLTIKRGDQVIELRSGHAANCQPIGFIRAGDEVRGSVSGAASSLKVGETAGC